MPSVNSPRARPLSPRPPFAAFAAAVALAGCAGPAETAPDAARTDAARDATVDAGVDAPRGEDASQPGLDARPDAGAVTDAHATADATMPADVAQPINTTSLLLDGTHPMPCADPSVVSEGNAEATYYAFCTGMAHIWRTTDWVHFTDARASARFDLTGLDVNGRNVGAWWAPGVVYAPGLHQYVMWVSVPAARGHMTSDGWDTRSLAVLTAPTPGGLWTFRRIARAGAPGEHFIDPFLFLDHDGGHYVFWKQYGGAVSSSIMGSAVDASWLTLTGSAVEIMNGYGGPGTWEDNVRENPAVVYEASGDRHHFLFSGGHFADSSYATGHALSTCGPLCVNAARGGWHMVSSGDRGIDQVVRSIGDSHFAHGGPGGAVFQDDRAQYIVYAAAADSAGARYLMRQRVLYRNGAPYVDTAGHRPAGF